MPVVDDPVVNDGPTIGFGPLHLTPIGPEFLANTVVANAQSEPWVASLASGGFVLAWRSFGPSPTFDDVKGQVFDASGAKVGGEFLVNTATNVSQIQPTVTGLAAGGFIVAWQDAGTSPASIKAQLYSAAGVAVGGEMLVSTDTGGSQQQPAVTALAAGGFVLTWTSFNGTDVKAQLYDASGAKVGAEFLANTTTTNSQSDPAVASLASGGFVVSWTDTSTLGGDASSTAVKAQVFDASGAKVGGEFLVNTATTGLQAVPAVTGLASGGFVVGWTDASAEGGDPSGRAVKAQVYDAAGARVGAELLVNTTTSGDQQKPSLVALPEGGFLVTWQDATGDASGAAVKAQLFDDQGDRVGGEFLVNTSTAGSQFDPSVTVLATGAVVVAWNDLSGQGGDADGGIKAQLFRPVAIEQTSYDLKGTIQVDDVDAGAGPITVTLSVDYGILVAAAGTSGAGVTGSGTGTVTVSGTLAQVQALLGSDATSAIAFVANSDDPPGSATLEVVVDDNGNSGTDPGLTGGPASEQATATLDIDIVAINDAPSGSDSLIVIDEDQAHVFATTDFGFSDPEQDGFASIVVTSLAGAGSLKLDGTAVSAGSTVSAAAIAGGRLVFAPAPNASGAGYASVTFQVKDDGGTSLGGADTDATPNSIAFDVAAVNDLPTLSFAPLGRAGTEFLANTVVANAQSEPWVAGLASGGFVLAWRSFGPSPTFDDVKGQVFDASGAKVGGEFLVNTATNVSQIQPTVTGLAAGGFIVAWQDAGTSPASIKAQRYDAAGVAVGGEMLVSTDTGGSQQQPAVTALAAGGFVLTWTSFNGTDVKAQLYDASGAKVGAEFLANTTTTNSQNDPAVASLASGGFVVSWTDTSTVGGDASSTAVKAQVFDASGAKVGGEFLVNTATTGLQAVPAVTGLASGGFVVGWTDASAEGGDPSGRAVKAQVYDAAGARVGAELLVNTTTSGDQQKPSLVALPEGGFLVTWQDATGDASGAAVRAQMFDDQGHRVGAEFLVNTSTAGSQFDPSVTVLATGAVVVAWNDLSGQGGDADGGIKAQLLHSLHTREQGTYDLTHIVSVGDDDAGASTLTVTLSADYGSLSAAPGTSGVSVSGSGTGTVTLTGQLAQLRAFLGSDSTSILAFTADTDNPPSIAELTVTADDGHDIASGAITIGITPVNDPPALAGLSAAVTFAEDVVNAAPVLLDASVTFADPEGNFAGGMLTLSGVLAEDRVAILNEGVGAGQIGLSGANVSYGGTVIGAFAGGVGATLTVTFNASATPAALEALIEHLTYANASDTPTASRALVLNVADAAGADLPAAARPAFTLVSGAGNPFHDLPVFQGINPDFIDLDADGDLDMVAGEIGGTIRAFRNDGTAFTELGGAANPFAGIDVGDLSTPTFGDLDGDHDLDLVVGNLNGLLLAWRNDGGAFTALVGAANPLNGVDVGSRAAPAFVDLDNDGDADLAVGNLNGNLAYFRNTGGVFTELSGAANPFSGLSGPLVTSPGFADLDGDGDLDLGLGSLNSLLAYRNDGGIFTQPLATTFSGMGGTFLALGFADLDGDGDLDAISANANLGTLGFLENAGQPITVNVTAQNDVPVAADDTLSALEDVATLFTAAQIVGNDSDPDDSSLLIQSVASIGGGTAILNPSGSVTFTSAANFSGVASFTYIVSDGHGGTDEGAVTVNVAAVNDRPTLSGFAPTLSFGENAVNAGPLLLDADVAFGDVEGNVGSGMLTVGGLLTEDRIAVRNQGNAAGEIGVSGSDILYGGIVIGSFSGGVGTPFTVALNGAANVASVEALIENLTYANASDTPTLSRTLVLNFSDSDGGELSVARPAFTLVSGAGNPFHDLPVFQGINPDFIDLDADGDLDMVAGEIGGTIRAFRNDGTAFTELGGAANPFAGIDVGDLSTPTFGDLDGDHDLDLVVGNLNGLLLAWRNDGGAFTALVGAANPLNGVDVGSRAAPAFVDLDNDGDADLAVGNLNGNLAYFRNTGGVFTELSGAANPFSGLSGPLVTSPGFADLDGDGDLDLGLGSLNSLLAYRNDGGIFTQPLATTFSGMGGTFLALGFADLDGDGDLDAISANANLGTLGFLENAGQPITVNVTPEAESLSLAGLATSVTYDENIVNATPQLLDSDVTFTDTHAPFDGTTLTVSGLLAEDQMAVRDQGAAAGQVGQSSGTVSYGGIVVGAVSGGAGATLTIVFNAAANAAAVEAVIENLTYANTSDTPTQSRTLTVSVADPGGTDTGQSIDVDVTTRNDAPVLDLNGASAGIDNAASYTENAVAVVLAGALTVADVDDASLEGATVAIGAGFQASTDVLSIGGLTSGTASGIGFSYDGSTGVLSLTGTATLAAYEGVLRQVAFLSTSEAPGASRAIGWTLDDGDLASAGATTTLTVTAVDDAPVAKPDAVTTNEATAFAGSVFGNNGSGADSDVDGPALAVATVNGVAGNVGTQIALASGALLTLNADGTFGYDPNGAFNATPSAASGASNTPRIDSFSYGLVGGGTATVTMTVTGLDSNDLLLGTSGVDLLLGGVGNDAYIVGQPGDRAKELAGEGTDTVYTVGSWSLEFGSEVEVIIPVDRTSTAALNLTGNNLAQTIYGNNGVNALNGGAGDDTMYGLGGNDGYIVEDAGDKVIEFAGGGSDTVYALVSYALTFGSHVEVLTAYDTGGTGTLTLAGNDLANTIYGNAGVNLLNGGHGVDTMYGFGGNDAYLVEEAGDQAIEAGGGGFDTVYALTSYALVDTSEIEVLAAYTRTSTAAMNLTGNALANVVTGNDGANVLDGKGGLDILVGLGGNDTFLFDSALGGGNVDRIGDFTAGSDKIALDDSVFTTLTPGALGAGAFVTGGGALDAGDRIVYDQVHGLLYFDADGSGAGAQVLFARVDPGLGLNASDFVIV